ncbi:MAG: arsenic transporter [Rhodoferax sp.]|jgi:arsenical pump membrane protein
MNSAQLAIWTIAVITMGGVLVRPFKLPEATWAVTGAMFLLAFQLLPWQDGLRAVSKGTDVYLFLAGMMLLSEAARREGLFDWVAVFAVNHAKGSQSRLFLLVYGVGIVVTTFLSNDAAAVVLTPAVFAAARKANAKPLPYLFICAFIANAASFVLPISNPANIVLYGDHMPPLGAWFASFALPSAVSIVVTYVALRFTQRACLVDTCAPNAEQTPLTAGGWTALGGLVCTGIGLLLVSWFDKPLGLPTCVLGTLTAVAVLVRDRVSPWQMVKQMSWSVLPLVGGLFVVVEALQRTGVVNLLTDALRHGVEGSLLGASAAASTVLALGSNVINNLPAGLIASTTILQAKPPQVVIDSLLIGVDLGPNLSITGSLATILWLTALRRDGENVTFWRFLKVGCVVMPPALVLSVGARFLFP